MSSFLLGIHICRCVRVGGRGGGGMQGGEMGKTITCMML